MKRTALDNEHGYAVGSSSAGPRSAPYPPWVQTADARRRWDVCAALATFVSMRLERSGEPDARFVWLGTRALYNSEIPTDASAGADTEAWELVDRFVFKVEGSS